MGKNITEKYLIICLVCILMIFTAPISAYAIDMPEGEYAIGVDVEGGSRKATVTDPCLFTITDGEAYALLEWSSPYYDYMIVDGQKYYPVNEDGNSKFEVPILKYDEGYKVIADTTAMSTAHEVEYTLTFHSDEIIDAKDTPQARAKYSLYMACAIIGLCIIVSRVKKYRYKKRMKQISH